MRHESNFEEEITPSGADATSGARCPILTLSYFRCWLPACLFYGCWKAFIVIAEKNENEIEWLLEELDEGAYGCNANSSILRRFSTWGYVYHEYYKNGHLSAFLSLLLISLVVSIYILFLNWGTVYDDS